MGLLELSADNIYKGHLILVNKHYPVHQESIDCTQELIPVDNDHENILLYSHAQAMLNGLIDSCDARGKIVPVSGYRSFQEQEEIFNTSLRDNGKEFTLKYVALPNCSEHHTGLAVDMAECRESIDFLTPYFPYSGICQRFRQKAAQFGFIERYPQGKENITGISHEPWHFRYVGYPHSRIITDMGLTLEEYISFLKDFSYHHPLLFPDKALNFSICYTDLTDSKWIPINVQEEFLQISGNNVDGVIMTSGLKNLLFKGVQAKTSMK